MNKQTDLEFVKELLARIGINYCEKSATQQNRDHVLILGFDNKGRKIQGVIDYNYQKEIEKSISAYLKNIK